MSEGPRRGGVARENVVAPTLEGGLRIPVVTAGASAHLRPYRSSSEHQIALGFPAERPDDWHDIAVRRIGELVQGNRALQIFMDTCVKCGACTDKCHYFLGTGDPLNMPVGRQELFRSVYRRYHTVLGRYLPWLVGARDLDEDMLEAWYTYFNQCSQCRRCSVYCPVGIDTSEISMAAREVLHGIGIGQKYTDQVIAKVHSLGNNLGLPQPALADTLAGLEEDVLEETGVSVRFPLDEAGAEVLLVTPSADFFAEPHVDGLIGYAKVLHQAGITWTFSSHASEAANFGLFVGSEDNMRAMAVRIREAALELGVRRIVFGECGHAWRVAHAYLEALAGPFDFLDRRYPLPQHIVEVTHDLIARGALRLDPGKNDARVVSFHDSCNVARASRMGSRPGGQLTLPREVLKAVCNHVVEMPAGTVGEATFCCGGGGGLLTDEMLELRVKGALPRMQAFDTVSRTRAVTHLVAICAICKSQFSRVLPHYGFDMEQVLSLHHLVGDAIVLGEEG